MALRLSIHAAQGKSFIPYLRRHLRAAHNFLSPPLTELSIALVDDRTISRLHDRFLNIPKPTDVLTFELDRDAHGAVISGEIVICVPEARRQSRIHHTALNNELLLYALHGMLHLCGLDDRTPRGYKAMHRAEDDIMTHLGIGPVFRPDGAR